MGNRTEIKISFQKAEIDLVLHNLTPFKIKQKKLSALRVMYILFHLCKKKKKDT